MEKKNSNTLFSDKAPRVIKKPSALVLSLLPHLYRLLVKGVRVLDVGLPMEIGSILTMYHQNFYILPKFRKLYGLKGQNFSAIVSSHADGELVATILQSFNIAPLRGDSLHESRSVLRAGYRAIKEKHNLAVAVDGPVGPALLIKPGVMQMAKKTGAPLQMIMVHYENPIIFKKSWDQFRITWPISKAYTFCTQLYYYNTKISRDKNTVAYEEFLAGEKIRFQKKIASLKSSKR